ncbi:unnamed protein product [Cuscuta campestris]|uniref:Chlorophyll a-b binding protein, chloroplastic n=2 Tax=Cuscuta sect. Cleistogrammica TaxID=1824901 RepID=A0A484L4K2_9ASTE|nr:hypothetical protein DM860_007199 [Cuscuta australis]VFQ71267.1 unnamed protein product [Cuscuta campestris]
MAATLLPFSSSSFSTTLPVTGQQQSLFPSNHIQTSKLSRKPISFIVHAANPPAGVEFPKDKPKLKPTFLGFTRTAEIWNSRACMIGLIGVFILELIMNKGVLEIAGVNVGKGLDLPL